MQRLRNRKGAMLVLGAVVFTGLMVMALLAIDFSRVVAQRNQLHTATDAGALAGAVQLLQGRTTAADTAIAYTQINNLPGATTPTVELGRWNDTTRTFSSTALAEATAIRVSTQRSTNFLLGGLVNVVPATMRRTSVAWANAPLRAAPCIRPWALPYDSLLARLGISNPNHVLNQLNLTQLQNMSLAARRITLKLGSNNSGNAQPGNYNAVVVPGFWQALTGTYRSPPPPRGGNEYQNRIASQDCSDLVGVGDSLDVEPGNKVGPTSTGTQDLCDQYGGMSGNVCLNTDGTVGIPIKVVLYGIEFGNRLNGRDDPIVVRAIGGFVLERIELSGPDKSAITGYFDVPASGGVVGSGGNSGIVRPILVQ